MLRERGTTGVGCIGSSCRRIRTLQHHTCSMHGARGSLLLCITNPKAHAYWWVCMWEHGRGGVASCLGHRRTNQLSMHGPYLDPTSLGLLHNELLHGTLWVAGPLLGPGSTQAHAARKVGRLRPQLNEARDRWARGLSMGW